MRGFVDRSSTGGSTVAPANAQRLRCCWDGQAAGCLLGELGAQNVTS
ncbi:hypothetical protein MYA_5618 [Burkholderia sp. KJ006]|nr:hypothetical protein MYA_5618 [Burkholderia sp. KJ006]